MKEKSSWWIAFTFVWRATQRVARLLIELYANCMSLNPEHVTTRDSCFARRDARWRLAAFVLAIVGVALLRQIGPASVALGFALLLAITGRVPGNWLRARLGLLLLALIPFLVLLPFTVERGEPLWEWRSIAITDAGLIVAGTLAMKTVALVTLALTLLATAPLHVTLCAASKLGAPKLIVQLVLLTYRYVFVLLEELGRLRVALRVRGFRNATSLHAFHTIGQVTGTLLVRGSDRAERVSHAMRCRGFDGHFRTLTRFQSTPADVLMFLLIVGEIGRAHV